MLELQDRNFNIVLIMLKKQWGNSRRNMKCIERSEMALLEVIYTKSEVKNSSPCSSVHRTQRMKQ